MKNSVTHLELAVGMSWLKVFLSETVQIVEEPGERVKKYSVQGLSYINGNDWLSHIVLISARYCSY